MIEVKVDATKAKDFGKRWGVIPHIFVGFFLAVVMYICISFISLNPMWVFGPVEVCGKATTFSPVECEWTGAVFGRFILVLNIAAGWLLSFMAERDEKFRKKML